jgi:outer membrane receptor protein involved in Fe transport
VLSLGAEVGVHREWRQGYMLGVDYAYQYSRFLASTSVSDLLSMNGASTLRHVPNSPNHLASVKGAVPILARGLTAATRLTFQGPVYDRNEESSGPPQSTIDPAVIWDLILSGREDRWGLTYSLGVYNVTDWRYFAPVSVEFRQTSIVQNGRTFLASANLRF